MKTIFTLLLATSFTLSAFAYDEGRLTITMAQNRNYTVQINGRLYNDGDNTITLQNIRSGNYDVRVYRTGNQNNNRRDRNGRRGELVYSSTIYVRPSYHVDVMINRFGKALVDEQVLRRDWNDDEFTNGQNDNNYRQPMSDQDFNQLLNRVKGQWFSSSKLRTAKHAIPNNTFRAAQVRELLQAFTSDSEKLELAKLAYRSTIDQRNYYTVIEVLSFQSSREELEQFIRNYR